MCLKPIFASPLPPSCASSSSFRLIGMYLVCDLGASISRHPRPSQRGLQRETVRRGGSLAVGTAAAAHQLWDSAPEMGPEPCDEAHKKFQDLSVGSCPSQRLIARLGTYFWGAVQESVCCCRCSHSQAPSIPGELSPVVAAVVVAMVGVVLSTSPSRAASCSESRP